ncbi:MAG: carboxymuconolactone decarboxylase family protein [Psychrobium sp.]
MTRRLNYAEVAPQAMELLFKQEVHITQQFKAHEKLTVDILHLIKLRASQINHCGYCVDMHNKEALAHGESIERLSSLVSWRDMPYYTNQERAALQWCEALTTGESIDDVLYQHLLAHFGEQALVELTIAINAINSWNRIGKSFKPTIGCYQAS